MILRSTISVLESLPTVRTSYILVSVIAGFLAVALACGDSGGTSASTGGSAATEASASGSSSGTTSDASTTGSGTSSGSGTGTATGTNTTEPTTGGPITSDGTSGSTGGTGSSASTTDMTTGSSTGGGEVCTDLSCGDCFACASLQPDYCEDQKVACAADVDCVALAACVEACPPVGDPGFEACHDDCVDDMPGENLFKDLGACLACDTCGCDAKDHPEC